MSYHSKDVYEGKARYAVQKNKDNSEILVTAGMSQEEVENISTVCQYRHDLHANLYANASSLFNTESSEYDYLWEKVNFLKEYTTFDGLDECTPTDSDWYMWMEDEDKAEYHEGDETYDDEEHSSDAYDNFVETEVKKIADQLENLNTQVEQKLKTIDEEHGTTCCPTGASRI